MALALMPDPCCQSSKPAPALSSFGSPVSQAVKVPGRASAAGRQDGWWGTAGSLGEDSELELFVFPAHRQTGHLQSPAAGASD